MSVESPTFGYQPRKHIEPRIKPKQDAIQAVEEVDVFVDISQYVERASTVSYLSKKYIVPYDISKQHKNFLEQSGFEKSDVKLRTKNAYTFLENIQRNGPPQDIEILGAEESGLLYMYNSAIECLEKEEAQQPNNKYIHPDERVKAADTFVKNFLRYPSDRRSEILVAMGFTKEEAKKVGINIGKAAVSTVAINIVDGPALNVVGLTLGKVIGSNLADYVNQSGPSLQWGMRAGAVSSALAFHGSRFLKTKHTQRAIRNKMYYVPNVAVGAAAMVNEYLIGPEEKSNTLDFRLFLLELFSIQSVVDEALWTSTAFLGDYGITYTAGNIAGIISNFAQMGYMETMIQYKNYIEHMEAKFQQGFVLEENDKRKGYFLLQEVQSATEEAAKIYQLISVDTNDQEDSNYDFNTEQIASDPLYQLQESNL